MDQSPLAGVRVLELGGGISSGFAGRLLAGYGADVARIDPAAERLTADEQVYLLAGKRRVRASGEELQRLAAYADILVEDGAPGALATAGLAVAELRATRPELVIVSISPFGQEGPYAAYKAGNIVSFAMGGLMSLTGSPNREPLQNGGSQAEYLGGMNAFGAALTAYFGALIHGEGDWVNISLQECAAGMLELYGPGSAFMHTGPQIRMGNHVRAVWAIYPCVDGYAGVCCLERQVPALFRLLGLENDDRFRDPTTRAEHDDELTAIMYGWFAERTKAEVLAESPVHKIPFGAVLTPADLLANKNLETRGMFDTIQTSVGEARVPGRPFLGLPWRAGPLQEPSPAAAVLAEWEAAR